MHPKLNINAVINQSGLFVVDLGGGGKEGGFFSSPPMLGT